MKNMIVKLIWVVIPLVLIGIIGMQESFAEEKTWWLGENLKQGDYFSYKLCHVDYNDCTPFQIDFWIEKKIDGDLESKWLAKAVVHDENKIIRGQIEFGVLAADTIGGSSELETYRIHFNDSVTWLSAFATKDYQKSFSAPWGKIAAMLSIQVSPMRAETITTPAGAFDTIVVSWYAGNYNEIWVVDDFPFPVKALTYAFVATDPTPILYEFELLEYRENVLEDPFQSVAYTKYEGRPILCQDILAEQCSLECLKEYGDYNQEYRKCFDDCIDKKIDECLPLPPLKQMKNAIKPETVVCNEGLELIFKSTNGSPACVKPQTAEKLIERGWAKS